MGAALRPLQEAEEVAKGQLHVVVGAVGQRIPNSKKGLALIQHGADQPRDRLNAGMLKSIDDRLGHVVAAIFSNQRTRVLATEVLAGLPQETRVHAGVANVRKTDPNTCAQRQHMTSVCALDQPETNMSGNRTQEVQLPEEL